MFNVLFLKNKFAYTFYPVGQLTQNLLNQYVNVDKAV